MTGASAVGTWDLLVPCKDADGTSRWMCGVEDDEYARDHLGTWRHSRMALTTVFMSPTGAGSTGSGRSRGGSMYRVPHRSVRRLGRSAAGVWPAAFAMTLLLLPRARPAPGR